MKSFNSKKILLIDNYDSFTFNLVQQIASLGCEVKVVSNDAKDIMEMEDFTHLVVSPGPKDPSDCGFSLCMIKKFAATKPILGVCLGHQIIGSLYGANVIPAALPVHGKTAPIKHVAQGLFQKIPQNFIAARYHSLILEPETLPSCFRVLATYDKIIMAIEHKKFPHLCGVQFHPESFLTECGEQLIKNFLMKTYDEV